MSTVIRMAVILCFGVVAVVGATGTAIAQDGMEGRLRALEDRLQQQDQEIQNLRSALAEQQEASASLETEMDRYLGKVEDASWWQEPNTLRAFYKTGLHFETADGNFKLAIGGRIMWDIAHFDYSGKEIDQYVWGMTDGEGYGDRIPNDKEAMRTEFRRVRYFMEGDIYGNVFYKVQLDFAGSGVSFKDVFLGVSGIPIVGHFRVGNQYEPIGLETQCSSKYITFIDRALLTEFHPERTAGLMVYNDGLDKRLTWQLGVFSGGTAQTKRRMGNAISARVTYAIMMENNGEQVVHVGIYGSWRDCKSEKTSVELKPTHMEQTSLLDANISDAKNETLLGFELLVIWSQFSFQAEYTMDRWDSKSQDDPRLWGWYAYASFFVTGEHRGYKGGLPGRVMPLSNFDMQGGLGAIEFAIRYAMMEFDDLKTYPITNGPKGGQSDITFAVNWYLNPQTRIMLNYMIAYLEGVDNQINIIIIRFQIDF